MDGNLDGKRRCDWAPPDNPLYREYHDKEWGVPVHDDRRLFELLILEGAQAGLSWATILRKRQNFRNAFAEFNPTKVAKFEDAQVGVLLADSGIVRNELKIRAAIRNASAFLVVQREFGSFDSYIWSFVDHKPRINRWHKVREIPSASKESAGMSGDLAKRGFRFVGPTICYAFMQAVGMVNDHEVTCFRHSEVAQRG